ncbi:MAG: Rrf2 family transcriptional regulator [Candidatus Eremiobacteraeota bacterium]|nr:Rrf2 family transcriptional regulator [Candidatus Eremiobacteraeota bacterium]
MHLTASADYALRAVLEIAAADPELTTAERISKAQGIPLKFIENILGTLKRAGIVNARRGVDGGYWLAKPATRIALADVIRAIEGPLANVRGTRPEQLRYSGPARPLKDVWIAVRANLRSVLEEVTVADVLRAKLPPVVSKLTCRSEAWQPH